VVHSLVSAICWDSASYFGWFPTNERCHSEILGCCNGQQPSLVFSHFSSLQEDGILLVGCHQRNLPVAVLKMLTQSLISTVWGPSLSHDLQSRLEKMFNRAVRVVYRLRKFDHVSALRRKLEWLFGQSLIQHHCLLMLYRHYHAETENTILLNPLIQFSRKSHYETRAAPYLLFHVDLDFHLLRFFCSKGT